MTHTTDLNAMTIAQLKEFYSSLSNPISVIGTGKNGCKIKRDWIDAIEKSLIAVNGDDQSVTEEVIEEAIADDEIPFYGKGTEPYIWEDQEEPTEEELIRVRKARKQVPQIDYISDEQLVAVLRAKEKLDREQEYKTLPKQEIFGVPISFGWTADRLLARIKSVTRRTWKIKYAQMFINAYQQGKLIQAFDKDRRYEGKLIGYLKISDIYRESIFDMPESDVQLEGFPELSKEEFIGRFFSDIESYDSGLVWVIRFQFIPLQSSIAKVNCDHHEVLEKYEFRFFGDLIRADFLDKINCFMEKIGQWEIFSIPGIDVKSGKQFLNVYLLNRSIFECWTKQFYLTGKSPKAFIEKCLTNSQKCCLEMIYSRKDSGGVLYENKTKR